MLKRAVSALRDGLEATCLEAVFLESYPNYVGNYMHNLVPGIEPVMFEGDLRQGSGSELDSRGKSPPKFAAAHSSAALAVNCFAPFKIRIDDLRLLGHGGFNGIDFEHQCPIWPESQQLTPPNLDAMAMDERGVVAIESKCTEFLQPKKAKFAPRYEGVVEDLLDRPWLETYKALKNQPALFHNLDAAQLVKHCLGLRKTFPDQDISLVYVFWEPENAIDLDIFNSHRSEIIKFTEMVAGSEINFAAFSYPELWIEWTGKEAPQWLLEHVEALGSRYSVNV
jgi:hypothetical protein